MAGSGLGNECVLFKAKKGTNTGGRKGRASQNMGGMGGRWPTKEALPRRMENNEIGWRQSFRGTSQACQPGPNRAARRSSGN